MSEKTTNTELTADYMDYGTIDYATNQATSTDKIRPSIDERKICASPNGKDGKAQIWITGDRIVTSYMNNGVVVDQNGIILAGPTHIVGTPSNLRVAGFWAFNDELLTTLPSTTYTPIPTLIYKESSYLKYGRTFLKLISETIGG